MNHIMTDPIKSLASYIMPVPTGTKCSICLDTIMETNNVITTCNHYYCLSCLLTHLETDNKCPLCRDEIETKRPFKYKQIKFKDAMKYIEDHLENANIYSQLLAVKHSNKKSHDMLESVLKLHMIEIAQKLIQHQFGIQDEEEVGSENDLLSDDEESDSEDDDYENMEESDNL